MFKFSVLIPKKLQIGSDIQAAVDPVIPKIINILRICKLEFIPHLVLSLLSI